MPDEERYEVFAIRYGRRDTRKSEVYLNYGVYSEPDIGLIRAGCSSPDTTRTS